MYKLTNIVPPTDDNWYSCYEATATYEDGTTMHVTLNRRSHSEYVLKDKLNKLGVLHQVEKELDELLQRTYEDGQMDMMED